MKIVVYWKQRTLEYHILITIEHNCMYAFTKNSPFFIWNPLQNKFCLFLTAEDVAQLCWYKCSLTCCDFRETNLKGFSTRIQIIDGILSSCLRLSSRSQIYISVLCTWIFVLTFWVRLHFINSYNHSKVMLSFNVSVILVTHNAYTLLWAGLLFLNYGVASVLDKKWDTIENSTTYDDEFLSVLCFRTELAK